MFKNGIGFCQLLSLIQESTIHAGNTGFALRENRTLQNEIVEQVTQRHLAIFSGKRGLDNSCSLKQGWIMNDGSESLKDITEAHKILYY